MKIFKIHWMIYFWLILLIILTIVTFYFILTINFNKSITANFYIEDNQLKAYIQNDFINKENNINFYEIKINNKIYINQIISIEKYNDTTVNITFRENMPFINIIQKNIIAKGFLITDKIPFWKELIFLK